MPELNKPWTTHDFRVKMLDWSAARGSRLAYSCRYCGRMFCSFTINNHGAWATDGVGRALETAVSDRWLTEKCPRNFNATDDDDRKRLAKLQTQ
jgi:hypothetical protein